MRANHLTRGATGRTSLGDIVEAIRQEAPVEGPEFVEVANVLIAFFKRPAHEITIDDIHEYSWSLPLFLYFRRMTEDEVMTTMVNLKWLLVYSKTGLKG